MVERIGKYSIERELGQGGFGKVYLAFDPDAGRPVAIKKIRVEGDPDLLRRFQLEIRVTASLHHKNIVTIHASGEEDGDPYLVMEYLEGYTLKHVIEQKLPLTLLDKVRIMTQVAEGFAYAHSKGVVHRDVKPENIMLLPDDNVKIMDFGIALGPNRNTNVTQTGGIIGTPPYFAPEQLEGSKAGEQTDIFSFGDVYYELLTGVHPFQQYKSDWRSLQIAIMSYEPRPVSELTPGCPEALEILVHRTLAKEPEFRYQKFKEIQLDSEAILVDLKREGAAAIFREVNALVESRDLQTALVKINEAYELDPGNREIRRLREDINLRIQREQAQGRISELLVEADRHMAERHYGEAARSLELCTRLDPTSVVLATRLEDAKQRHDAVARANRLVAEVRIHLQKGHLVQAQDRLQEALVIDPENTEVRRLSQRVVEELDRLRLEQERQQFVREARAHLNGKRFAQALAVLDGIAKDQQDAPEVLDLRTEILREEAQEKSREQAERFNRALAKVRETMQAGELDRAAEMLDRLATNFAAEPGAAEAVAETRERLHGLLQVRELGDYQHRVRALLKDKSLRPALDLLSEALARFPDDTGLQRLKKSADDTYRSQLRSEAIAEAIRKATANRASGDVEGALAVVSRARQELGDELGLVNLANELEMEIEQQRYNAGLETLLKGARDLITGGKYNEAIGLLEHAAEFRGEAEVQTVLDSARIAAAVEEERLLVARTLAAVREFEARGAWNDALAAVESALRLHPRNLSLSQTADRLRDAVEEQRRRTSIEKHRGAIRAEAEGGHWKRAEEALRKARAEFPGERSFDDLAAQVEAGIYEDGWRHVATRVQENLKANTIDQAERHLRDQATCTVYADDPRWRALAEEVARRRDYEDVLQEAGRRRNEGHLSEAEELLTEVINRGAPDKRAHQLRGVIQLQKSEALRQQEIARIADKIRELLARSDLASAASELAAGRARYPGEEVWTQLQTRLDAGQQLLRRESEIAAAVDEVRQALARNDVREARSVLSAAARKFPDEKEWAALAAEVDEREKITRAQALAEGIRRTLQRDPTREIQRAGSPAAMRSSLLEKRREDLGRARAELDAARTALPGDALWDVLQSEIADREAFLNAESQIAARMSQALERGEWEQAADQIDIARTQYPDDAFWNLCAAEISRHREEAQQRADVARIGERIQGLLDRGDLPAAKTELLAAQARYPREAAWRDLQAKLDVRQAALARESEIAELAKTLRGRLNDELRRSAQLPPNAPAGTHPIASLWDVLRNASGRLREARAKYPDAAVWDALQAELSERQSQLQQEITDVVGACASLAALEWNAGELHSARTRYPGEPFWTGLQAVIDARRPVLEQASIAGLDARVRESLQHGDLGAARARLAEARKTHPRARVWDELQAAIDARQAEITRGQAFDSAEREVRVQLQRVDRLPGERDWPNPIELQFDAFQQANAALAPVRAKYSADPRLAALETEIRERRTQWREDVAKQFGDATRGDPNDKVLAWYRTQIDALRAKDPNERLWAQLKSEIDAGQALLKRRAEVAAAAERIRAALARGDVAQAGAECKAGRARFADEASWATLQSEIDACRADIEQLVKRAEGLLTQAQPAQAIALLETRFTEVPRVSELLGKARRLLEEQKRREDRDRARDRLLTLERQVEAETRKRKRAALNAEAKALAAPYPADPELAAIAARIHARAEAVTPPTPLPWKQIGIGSGAVAAAAAGIFLWLHRPHEVVEPPKPPVATIPIEIRTDPPGASVQVGDRACTTPNCTLNLQPGTTYQVEARLKDYETRQQSFTADAANRTVELTLQPSVVARPPETPGPAVKTGALIVQAGMPDVLVYIDGTPRNRTGRNGSVRLDLEAKAHEIRVERNGYDTPASKKVVVAPDSTQPVTFTLTQQSARLELIGAPSNVELRLDDRSFGRTDASGNYAFPSPVAPGRHRLEVLPGTLEGQKAGERTITQEFLPGQRVRLTWKAPPTPEGNPIPPGPTSPKPVPPPKPPSSDEVEEALWGPVRASNDPVRLREFRRDHPRYAVQVDSLLEQLAWAGVRSDNLDSLRRYLQDFPNGTHASDAKSQIAEMVWRSVDKSKIDQVRKFVADYPGVRITAEAQQMLYQLEGAEKERKKQVLEVLGMLNTALDKKRDAGVKQIWPSNTNRMTLDSMKIAGQKISLEQTGEVDLKGDLATIRCKLHTTRPAERAQGATVVFRYSGGTWTIYDLKVDQ